MNIFAFLNKSSDDDIRQSGTDVVARLTERNRKFEAFLLEKLAELESKIIPAEPTDIPPFEDETDIEPGTPDETASSETWEMVGDTLLTGTLLGAPATDTVDTPPDDNPPEADESLPDDNGKKGFWD